MSNDSSQECASSLKLLPVNFTDTLWFKLLDDFSLWYGSIHGYVCVVLCIIGIITNIVNTIVMTHKDMRTSVNVMFTAIALCDGVTMLSYLIYAIRFYVLPFTNTYTWMQLILAHMFITIVLHTAGIWLSVAVAFIRRAMLTEAAMYSKWMSVKRAAFLSVYILLACASLTIPIIASYTVVKTPYGYNVDWSPRSRENHCILRRVALNTNGIVFKFIPIILLAVLIASLIINMKKADRRRSQIFSARATHRPQRTDRTTILLITVVTIALICEVPQGILVTLCAIFDDVMIYVYPKVADFIDLLSLFNSAVNFFLYCVMSSRFRNVFWHLILPERVIERYFPEYANYDAERSVAAPMMYRTVPAPHIHDDHSRHNSVVTQHNSVVTMNGNRVKRSLRKKTGDSRNNLTADNTHEHSLASLTVEVDETSTEHRMKGSSSIELQDLFSELSLSNTVYDV